MKDRKYDLRECPRRPGVLLLYRYGVPVTHSEGLPSNAEYQFWCEILDLEDQLKLAKDTISSLEYMVANCT